MSEWDQRQLCSDGGCVGVLGTDGTCTTCGKRGRPADAPATATEAGEGSGAAASETDFDEDDEYYYEDEEDSDDDDDDDDDEGDAEPDEDGAVSTAWSGRSLCPDGACVGLIGENGSCKVCGKRAE